jgi:hypothetical protein
MSCRHRLLAFLVATPLMAIGLAHAAPVARMTTATAQLGDVAVRLPVPAGFADPSATPAPTRDSVARNLPAGSRLLGMMLAQDVLQHAIPGEPQRLSRYLLVTTRPDTEHGLTGTDFERLKSSIRAQAEQARAEHPRSPGLFDESLDSIAMATVQPLMTMGSAGGRSIDQVMAMGIVVLADRPVVVSVYSDDLTPGDIDWAERQVREWMARVRALNPN